MIYQKRFSTLFDFPYRNNSDNSFQAVGKVIRTFEQTFQQFIILTINSFQLLLEASVRKVSLRKDDLKICSKFTGEHPCRSVISINHNLAWVFSSKFATYFQSTFPKNTFQTTVSLSLNDCFKTILLLQTMHVIRQFIPHVTNVIRVYIKTMFNAIRQFLRSNF